jgi:DNA topoisomerase I
MPRVRRVDPNGPGLRRLRRGRGFSYLDLGGDPIVDDETLERVRGLGIPPAWEDVWISPDPIGHIQATGVDAAGRKQYVYHDGWRARRDREKFRRMEGFGRSLPRLRRRVTRDLKRPGLPRERALAGAVRLLDRSALRIGGDEYARANGSYGLATLRRRHAQLVDGDRVRLEFVGKSGKEHLVQVRDPSVVRLLREMEGASTADELLGWCDEHGWRDVRAADINAYLRDAIGEEFSAKDFRTWSATVLAASMLREHDRKEGRKAVTAVIRGVADQLGNTPAVARSSYVDPRVIDRFLDEGRVIEPSSSGRRATEEALLDLLDHDDDD